MYVYSDDIAVLNTKKLIVLHFNKKTHNLSSVKACFQKKIMNYMNMSHNEIGTANVQMFVMVVYTRRKPH